MIIQTQAFWASVLVPDRPLTLITFISPNRAQVSFKHSIAVSQEAAPCQQRRARETLPPAVNANIDIWRSTKEMEGEWAASRHTFLLAIIMWNVKSFLSSTTKSIFVNTKEYDWPDLCNGTRFKPTRTKNISQYENDLRSIFSLSDKAAHMIEVPQSCTDVIPGHGWHRTGPVEDGGRSTPTHSALRCDPSFPNRTMMRRPCALVKQKTRRLTSNNKHMLIWNNTDLQAHKLNNHIFCKRKKKPSEVPRLAALLTESWASGREHGIGGQGPPAMASHRTYNHVLPVTSQWSFVPCSPPRWYCRINLE